MIYLDSSALVKLAHQESQTRSLLAWLADRPGPTVSSALAAVEVTRALRRSDPSALPRVPDVLARVMLIPLDPPVLAAAAGLAEPLLRTLDALHLATALHLRAAALEFVTYDTKLAVTATSEGLTVAAPA